MYVGVPSVRVIEGFWVAREMGLTMEDHLVGISMVQGRGEKEQSPELGLDRETATEESIDVQVGEMTGLSGT